MTTGGQLVCFFCGQMINIRLVPLDNGTTAYLAGHEYCSNPQCELNQQGKHYAPRGKIVAVVKRGDVWKIPDHNSPALCNNFAED